MLNYYCLSGFTDPKPNIHFLPYNKFWKGKNLTCKPQDLLTIVLNFETKRLMSYKVGVNSCCQDLCTCVFLRALSLSLSSFSSVDSRQRKIVGSSWHYDGRILIKSGRGFEFRWPLKDRSTLILNQFSFNNIFSFTDCVHLMKIVIETYNHFNSSRNLIFERYSVY